MTEEEKALMAFRMRETMPVMRKALKLTQSGLSTLSGVSRSVISNAERGKQKPGRDTFLSLTAVFRSNPTGYGLFAEYGIDIQRVKDYLCIEKPAT